MKKFLSALAASILVISMFAGCGKSNDNTASSQAGTTGESQTAPESDFDSGKLINVVSREEGSGTRGAFVELTGVQEKKRTEPKLTILQKKRSLRTKPMLY